MTAVTKEALEAAALAAISAFPEVAKYVRAGDPRVLAQIRAQAAMLAMISEQVDVAQFEPFLKVRDGTILADATMKGILPLARPCRVTLSVTNGDTSPFVLPTGRRLQDTKGRIFIVDSGLTIGAGATVYVNCTQRTQRTITHTVSAAIPFYRIEVTQTDENVYLCSLDVWKGTQQFTYAPDWFNVLPGDFAHQVETDERRRLLVCMGSTGVIGYGVANGDVFNLNVGECEGAIRDLKLGSVFTPEYVYTTADGLLSATLTSVLDTGAAPPTMAELRTMARYPSIYDHNAVYLAEFDFLLRRYLSSIRFLSVWSEPVEESVRGANVANINTLFVSGLVTGMSATAFKAKAASLISRADNSYGINFVPAVLKPVSITISVKVAVIHDPATVEAQIRAAMLAKYGDGAAVVSIGQGEPLNKQAIYSHLRAQVPALQDSLSDIDISYAVTGSSNAFLQSSAFDNAAWTKTNLVVTPNVTIPLAPDGSASVEKMSESAINGLHYMTQNVGTLTVGDTWILSIFAMAAERSRIGLNISGEGTALFDLITGSVVNTVADGAGVIDCGNNLYRCWAAFKKTTTSGLCQFTLFNGAASSYAGVAGSGVYVWGAQAEKSLDVGGYLPTTTVAVTQANPLPEHFIHVSNARMTVNVALANYNSGLWNY